MPILHSTSGIPLSARLGYTFTSAMEFGAVLITAPEARCTSTTLHWSDAQIWVEQNLKALCASSLARDFDRFGLCIIRKTDTVQKYAPNAWRGREKMTYFGLGAEGRKAVRFDAGATWYLGNSVGQWVSGEVPVTR